MSEGRHSYVPFYASDWIAGTSRMTPMQELIYFRVCCYIWDKAEPCPEAELPLMLGAIDGWVDTLNQLIAAHKLFKSPDGSLVNTKALSVAENSKMLWEKKSAGGKKGARKTNSATPAESPADTPDSTPVESPGGTRVRVPTHNQNQNHKEEEKIHKKEFAEWYAAFPLHKGKGQAVKAYRTARKKTSAEILLAGAKRYAVQRAGEDAQYTKHPATWLNGECWEDERIEAGTGQVAPDHEDAREIWNLGKLLDKGDWHGTPGEQPTPDEARARLAVLRGEGGEQVLDGGPADSASTPVSARQSAKPPVAPEVPPPIPDFMDKRERRA